MNTQHLRLRCGPIRPVPVRRALARGLVVIGLAGCQTAPPPATTPPPERPPATADLHETPVPDGPWRPHRLAGCREDLDVPPGVERLLGLSSAYFRAGSGSDGMIELEQALASGQRHGLILLTLAQLYVMAGQGEPSLLPVEGPAADVGDWDRNRKRLLDRSRQLLTEAARARPDDAAVDYLQADAARAAGDFDGAETWVAQARDKCTGGRSFSLMQLYQELNRYPPRYDGGPAPEYPAEAVQEGISGDVVVDILLDPTGSVRQIVTVSSPSPALTTAAEASLRHGRYEAARLGKYGIWAWLRVTTAFNLSQG